MAKKSQDKLAALIRDVEHAAKRIRADIRKRAKAETKNLQKAAQQLRKAAVDVVGHVERYIRDLTQGKTARPATPATKTRTAAKRTTTKKASAKKPVARKATRKKTVKKAARVSTTPSA